MDPRILKTNDDYKSALTEAESLISLDPDPGTDMAERLDLLLLLVEKYESEKFPIDLPDPLEAIKFRMDEQGLKQRDLIPFIGSKSKVSEILAGKSSLTVSMIRALHQELGIPAEVLLQEPLTGIKYQEEIDWKKFPIKEMIKRRWLEVSASELKSDTKTLIEKFFEPLGGVEYLPAICRRTLIERSGKTMDKYALWAWIARVLTKTKSLEINTHDIKMIDKDFLEQVAHLSFTENGPLKAQKYLAEYNIALIIEPHLPRTRLDGASMLSLAGTPVIGLTLRHDRIDNFWFTLLHELVHIWKHVESSDEAFMDDLDSGPGKEPREREADRIAGEVLIPRKIWARSDAYRQRTPEAIQNLALELKIHPAIIAGRIRHDTNNFYTLSHMVGKGQVRKLYQNIEWN